MTAILLRLGGVVSALVVAWHLLAPSWPGIWAAMAHAGWWAVPALAALHMAPLVLCGLAWGSLMPQAPLGLFLLGRWVRDGFNEILAFVPLAGEVAGLRLLTRRGLKSGPAGAAMVVDLTAEVMAQVLFTMAGLALWQAPEVLMRWGVPGLAVALGAVAGFIAVQRGGGIRLLERLAGRILPERWQASDPADGIHANLMMLYGRPMRFIGAVALHLLAWATACAEAWLALRLLGSPISVLQAVMLESAVFALRSAAFFVPGALGLQEGGYALLAPFLGLSPVTAVTVSLLKRGRELLLGVPAVLAWAWISRRLPAVRGASPSSDRR